VRIVTSTVFKRSSNAFKYLKKYFDIIKRIMETVVKFVAGSSLLQYGVIKTTKNKYATFSAMGAIYALSQLGMSKIFKYFPSASKDWTALYLTYFLYETGMGISYKKYISKNEYNFFIFHHSLLITFTLYWRKFFKNINWKTSRWFFIWNSSAFTYYAMSLFSHYYPRRDKFYFKVKASMFLLQRVWRAIATYYTIKEPDATRSILINGLLPGALMEVIDTAVASKSIKTLYNRVYA
jgi:hypothetical protein